MQPHQKINATTFWFMLIVAIAWDLAQAGIGLIPFVGWILAGILGFLGKMHFWLWYQFRGVSFFEKAAGRVARNVARKISLRLIVFWSSFFLEIVAAPIPWLSVSVLITNLLIRSEGGLVSRGFVTEEQMAEFNRSLARGRAGGAPKQLLAALAGSVGRKRLARRREQEMLAELRASAVAE